mgnify:CR=1 FL=1
MKKKYKVISEDLQKNLIDFLDEIQFEAAQSKSVDDMHKVNFCTWAINELLESYDAYFKNSSKKSRNDYVDETFMDWIMPEMSDEEYEKLVDQFNSFVRGWEKEYNKKNPKKKNKRKQKKSNFKPHIEDISEYMSLEEIKEYLLEDSELTDEERFDLYYEEHLREQKRKQHKKDSRGSKPLDQIMKKLGITFSDGSQKKLPKKK